MTAIPAPTYPPQYARQLAEIIDAADPQWTRVDIAAALSAHRRGLDADRAAAMADQIVTAFPREPVDRSGALASYISELRMTLAVRVRTPPRTLWRGLPPIEDYTELAQHLDMTVSELEWFADHRGWLHSRTGSLQHYRVHPIPKRQGVRVLEIPKPRLRETQRRILRRILADIPPHDAAQGFVRGRSTQTFAAPHSAHPIVVRLDLRHCFETITVARVRAVFAAVGYPPSVARTLADLGTTVTPTARLRGLDPLHASILRARHLPQGAPTSPALANLVLRNLDRRLSGYATKGDLLYTRYGDDLAISGEIAEPSAVVWVMRQIVGDEGFTVHPDKTRIMYSHQQQRLAGLVVNDRPQVSRADYDAVRALLHNAIRTGGAAQNRDGHDDFRAHVYGKIAWIGATNATRRSTLLDMASRVDW